MLRWALIFFVLALVAALFGFGGLGHLALQVAGGLVAVVRLVEPDRCREAEHRGQQQRPREQQGEPSSK